MSESPEDRAAPKFRFRLRSLFWAVIISALGLTCFVQFLKLRNAELALARSAWARSDVAIPQGKFRLLVNQILEDPDTKCYVIRFEANEERYVTADGASTRTTVANDDRTHWAEITIVAMYDSTTRRMGTLVRAGSASGWAGGRSTYTVPPDVKPAEFVEIAVKPGLYDLTQKVHLGMIDGKSVQLSAK